ncbi:lysR family regulatory domain protein [Burkholderia cepacia]|nr:lysR family regulatory domain protein [Burkholderia cepacia]
MHVRDDRARAFGCDHTVALAHEQRIVEMRAQPAAPMPPCT